MSIQSGDIVRLSKPVLHDGPPKSGSLEERMIKDRVLLRVIKTEERGGVLHVVPEPVNSQNDDAVKFCRQWNPQATQFVKI